MPTAKLFRSPRSARAHPAICSPGASVRRCDVTLPPRSRRAQGSARADGCRAGLTAWRCASADDEGIRAHISAAAGQTVENDMSRKKLSEEQIRDTEMRTNAMGLFNQAHSYWKAAAALEKAKLATSHRHAPIYFLYYHAIELFLKSFLRTLGHLVDDLSGRKFGHRTCRLTDRARQLGLPFMDEDIEVFSLMSTTDAIIRSRYIRTGSFTWPTHGALDRTCNSLHASVGQALRKAGFPVRR